MSDEIDLTPAAPGPLTTRRAPRPTRGTWGSPLNHLSPQQRSEAHRAAADILRAADGEVGRSALILAAYGLLVAEGHPHQAKLFRELTARRPVPDAQRRLHAREAARLRAEGEDPPRARGPARRRAGGIVTWDR